MEFYKRKARWNIQVDIIEQGFTIGLVFYHRPAWGFTLALGNRALTCTWYPGINLPLTQPA